MTPYWAPRRRGMGDLPPSPTAAAGPPLVLCPVVTRHERRRVHPSSRRVTHLSHSETVGDAARGGAHPPPSPRPPPLLLGGGAAGAGRGAPHPSHPRHTAVAPACWAGVRVVA